MLRLKALLWKRRGQLGEWVWVVKVSQRSPERHTRRAGLGAFCRNGRDGGSQQSNPGLQEPERNHRVGDSQGSPVSSSSTLSGTQGRGSECDQAEKLLG